MNYSMEGAETERLLFRKLSRDDFDAWLPFHEDPRSSKFWSGIPQNPVAACSQQFDRVFERYEKGLGGMFALIDKTSDELIGLCGLLIQVVDGQEELEIGYSVLPTHWGKGFASEAAQKCKETAFKNGWANRLISIIHIDNEPSKKVALKNGMHLEKRTVYKNNPVYIFRIDL
ncbi:GNAT family N-acetyltransferase [Maribacter aurantiacus]|uniref:GNAT family N-acetyltransferase n=1 Tax=Maribacter aurantiacus TaxID=1882343 RepID=A0A5R8M7P9_9FLAO|nr:GNAT family N-acetyltransferase [Maribacter aurantiacus]TLF45602.1 GNAT family N-acetyltransferase [Maribacter aurantiacus]